MNSSLRVLNFHNQIDVQATNTFAKARNTVELQRQAGKDIKRKRVIAV